MSNDGFAVFVVFLLLALLVVGMALGSGTTERTYANVALDKMVEVCHNNNEIEKFVSRNRDIVVHCKNGAQFVITDK